MRTVLIAISAAFCGLGACSGSEEGSFTEQARTAAEAETRTGPGLWRVADDDTVVYLFGTVHILRPGTEWQVETVDTALAEADAVYFEADVESTRAQRDLNETVTRLGLYTDGRTLRDVLDEAAEREVDEAAVQLGVPLQSFDNFQPWFASFALTDIHQEKQGFDRSVGVERILGASARQAGKPIRFLETGAEQISLIASVSETEQIALLVQTAEQIEAEPDYLDRLVAEWAEGDVSALADMISDDEAFGSGEIYDRMLKGRNANWAEQIGDLLEDEAGTFFIAVGAAHLAGSDSVQEMLTEDGLVVARVNPRKTLQ